MSGLVTKEGTKILTQPRGRKAGIVCEEIETGRRVGHGEHASSGLVHAARFSVLGRHPGF